MKRYLLLLVLALLTGQAGTADAGILDLFKRQPKPNPSERVPALLATVKTDPDENKRAAAAEQLHDVDGTVYSDVVPVLADVLLHDKSAAVRAEAAKSLGRLRPATQQAGWALEHIAMNDPSSKARANARTALTAYQANGYQRTRTEEPPLAPPLENAASPMPAVPPNDAARLKPVAGPPVPVPEPEKPKPLSRFFLFGRRPAAPSPAVPVPPAAAPSPKAVTDGPELTTPK